MKRHLISALLGLSLMVCLPGLCLAANALIVHDGTPGIEADALGNLNAKLVAAAFTVTQNVGVPGGSLATYEQIWDIRFNNTTPLTGSDNTAYLTYMNGAGRLFLMGENAGFATRNNSIIAFIAAAGGPALTLVTPGNTENVLAPFTGPNPLTTITFLAAGGFQNNGIPSQPLSFITLDPGSQAGAAVVWPPGRLSGAPTGALIVVFDVNFLQAGADANSQTLIQNLIAYLAAPSAVPVTQAIPTMSLSMLLALAAVLAFVGFRLSRAA
jgi:hypothetical protein